jgi:ribonucleotide reductase alpha subunit
MSSTDEINDLHVVKRNGDREIVAFDKILNRLKKIGKENIAGVDNLKINYTTLAMKVIDQLYDGIHTTQIDELSAEQCASMASTHSDYNILAGRIVVSNHHKNTKSSFSETMEDLFMNRDHNDVGCPLLSTMTYVLTQKYADELNEMCVYDRDYLIDYFGFKTLERAYLLRINRRPVERPQHMWLRVSLGIHGEDLPKVKETYDYMSQKYFTHATPTLFNSGTPHPQLSSCYLIAMEEDSIGGIYNTLKDCALISKWAGGIGMHIHNVRASGSYIRGTGGTSNGIAPMLRVFNNTAKYVDQCLTPETILYSTNGPINISRAIGGVTRVFNTEGVTETIQNVLENPYNGNICVIHTLNRAEPLRVTPEHLIMALSVCRKYANDSVLQYELGQGLIRPDWVDAKYITKGDYIAHTIPNDMCVVDHPELTVEICAVYGKILANIQHYESAHRDEYVSTGAFDPDRNFYLCNTYEYIRPIRRFLEGKYIQTTVSFYPTKHTPHPHATNPEQKYPVIDETTLTVLYWPKNTVLPFRTTDFWDLNTGRLHISERWLFLPKTKIDALLTAFTEATQQTPNNRLYNNESDLKQNATPRIDKIMRDLQHEMNFLRLRLGSPLPGELVSNGMILTPVKDTYMTPYSGVVYDLQMKYTHNYLLEHGIVHNGGGKRNGSIAIYLEPWHADIEMFLQMRKNHGDEELKARDLFYALWIPDLFMERIKNGQNWTLLCPDECPGLADVYGDEFVRLYEKYEAEGKGRKTMLARDLWFQILDAQMETGTPYMLFKDACNRKSNQQNLGTIKSSNLCSEIVQYSSDTETAVCNLASVALPMFVNTTTQEFDYDKLHTVVKTIIYNLNQVIDVNFYPTEKTRRSNFLHRPVGLGVQGLADVFMMLDTPFYSDKAKELNRLIFETIYHASLEKSNEIAIERYEKYRGRFLHNKQTGVADDVFTPEELVKLTENICGAYSSFEGSPASRGILQFDMWGVSPSDRYDWEPLRESIRKHGLRNSLLISPMPTASTSQILGFNECIEPITSNIYSRRTIAGEFIMANKYLMNDLIKLNLWNDRIKNNIIANNGSVQQIDTIPVEIREKYKTVWEIPMRHLIDMAADRGAFICQSQSLNLWLEDPNYNTLTSMHFYSWKKGLKTGMYYLRRRGKHQAQQFTIEPEKKVQEEDHEICEMCSS